MLEKVWGFIFECNQNFLKLFLFDGCFDSTNTPLYIPLFNLLILLNDNDIYTLDRPNM